MKISNLLEKIAGTAIIGGALLGSPAYSDAYLFFNVGTTTDHPLEKTGSYTSIPEYMRTVPIHPSDSYANARNNGPIKDSGADFSVHSIGIEMGIGGGIQAKGFRLEVLPELALSIGKDFSDNLLERNYTNAPGTSQRGYGAALTYYNTEIEFTKLVPKLSVRASYDLISSEDSSIGIGGGIFAEYIGAYFDYPFQVNTGWE